MSPRERSPPLRKYVRRCWYGPYTPPKIPVRVLPTRSAFGLPPPLPASIAALFQCYMETLMSELDKVINAILDRIEKLEEEVKVLSGKR